MLFICLFNPIQSQELFNKKIDLSKIKLELSAPKWISKNEGYFLICDSEENYKKDNNSDITVIKIDKKNKIIWISSFGVDIPELPGSAVEMNNGENVVISSINNAMNLQFYSKKGKRKGNILLTKYQFMDLIRYEKGFVLLTARIKGRYPIENKGYTYWILQFDKKGRVIKSSELSGFVQERPEGKLFKAPNGQIGIAIMVTSQALASQKFFGPRGEYSVAILDDEFNERWIFPLDNSEIDSLRYIENIKANSSGVQILTRQIYRIPFSRTPLLVPGDWEFGDSIIQQNGTMLVRVEDSLKFKSNFELDRVNIKHSILTLDGKLKHEPQTIFRKEEYGAPLQTIFTNDSTFFILSIASDDERKINILYLHKWVNSKKLWTKSWADDLYYQHSYYHFSQRNIEEFQILVFDPLQKLVRFSIFDLEGNIVE